LVLIITPELRSHIRERAWSIMAMTVCVENRRLDELILWKIPRWNVTVCKVYIRYTVTYCTYAPVDEDSGHESVQLGQAGIDWLMLA
jgi:hypothetical protein